MDSQAGFAESVKAGAADQAAGFRFSITWSYLLTSAGGSKNGEALIAQNFPARVSEPRELSASEQRLANVRDRAILVSPRPRATSPPRASPEPAKRAEPSGPNLYPALLFYPGLWNGWKLLLGAVLLAFLVIPIWRALPKHSKSRIVEVETSSLAGGWRRESASATDAGAKQARQLILYQPSLNAANGQFEFTWTVDDRGVGWIFRAKDVANYYAMRVKVLSRAPDLKLSVEHFSVQLGEEGSHSEKVLVLPRNDRALRIKLNVAGPSFTLYVQGSAADYWTDTRLTAGAFGFYEEWRQAADVRAVRMSFSRWTRTRLERTGMNAHLVANLLSALFGKRDLAFGGA